MVLEGLTFPITSYWPPACKENNIWQRYFSGRAWASGEAAWLCTKSQLQALALLKGGGFPRNDSHSGASPPGSPKPTLKGLEMTAKHSCEQESLPVLRSWEAAGAVA